MAKGRTLFTIAEIEKLRQLFLEKDNTTDQDEKKAIRTKIRKMGFYISDFSKDMNSLQFDHLLKSGKISIINYNEHVKSNYEDKEQGKMTKIHDCHDHKEGLIPWIDEFSEILILGSLPSDVSIKEQAYYQNKSKNSFWKIMHGLFGQGDDSKEFLLKNHVALWDCLAAGNRKGSMDANISGGEIPNKLPELLESFPNIKRIVINGCGAKQKYFDKYFPTLPHPIEVITVPSSSNACAMSFEAKLLEWKNILK
nr:DNA-deoxyinosine glycosylase [Prevotella sp.]